MENPPSCPSPWLSLHLPSLCSHIFRADTILGNNALAQGVGNLVRGCPAEGRILFLRQSFSFSVLANFCPASSKAQAKIFISWGEALSWVCLSQDWAQPRRPGLFTPLWLPQAADSVGPGAVNLPPNHTKLLCAVWPVPAGLFITLCDRGCGLERSLREVAGPRSLSLAPCRSLPGLCLSQAPE